MSSSSAPPHDADPAKGASKTRPVNGMAVFDKFKPSPPLSSPSASGSGTPTTTTTTGHPHPTAPVNKHLDAVIRTPGRQPSPQPTHLGIPGGSHRVLSEEDPGYVAAKFEGKQKQMETGRLQNLQELLMLLNSPRLTPCD